MKLWKTTLLFCVGFAILPICLALLYYGTYFSAWVWFTHSAIIWYTLGGIACVVAGCAFVREWASHIDANNDSCG